MISTCQNDVDPNSSENIELKDCLGSSLYELLDQSEKLFDQNILKHHSLETELDKREAYRRYLELLKEERFKEVYLDRVDSEMERKIIYSDAIKEIFEYSQILGDTIYFSEPGGEEKMLNEIIFNYRGRFAECIKRNNNQFIKEYLESKELIGDLKLSILAQSFVNQIKKEDLLSNDIIKKIIIIEFYLRPLINRNWKK